MRARTTWTIRRSFAHARRATRPSWSHTACALRKARVFRGRTSCRNTCAPGASKIALPWPANAERKRPRLGDVGDRLHPAPPRKLGERPRGNLLQAEHVGVVRGGEPDHLLEKRAALGPFGIAVEHVPGADEQRHERASLGACSGGA